MSKQKYNDSLNIEREAIIMKIYLTLSDVRQLVRCNWDLTKQLFNEASQMCLAEGKKNLNGRVHYTYVLNVIGISEQEIHKMAKIERQIKMSLHTANDEATK